MKQSKLIKKLNKLPLDERELFLEEQLQKVKICKAGVAAMEAGQQLAELYIELNKHTRLSKESSYESDYDIKRKLELDILNSKLEAEVEKNKCLEEKIEVLERINHIPKEILNVLTNKEVSKLGCNIYNLSSNQQDIFRLLVTSGVSAYKAIDLTHLVEDLTIKTNMDNKEASIVTARVINEFIIITKK